MIEDTLCSSNHRFEQITATFATLSKRRPQHIHNSSPRSTKEKIEKEYQEAIEQLNTYAGSEEYEKNVFMVIEPGITLFSWPEKVVEKIREIVADIPNGTHGLHFHAIDRE